jgi:excisionase family DNA binding protein
MKAAEILTLGKTALSAKSTSRLVRTATRADLRSSPSRDRGCGPGVSVQERPMVEADPFRQVNADEHLHDLLTVEDVAALLKVSKSWVYEHTRARGTPRSDRLPHIKIGKYIRFDGRALRAFLDKKCRRT